jgi:predicted dehydrogenase
MIDIGIVGTSWFADLMYLPSLQDHPHGRITAICGRNLERAQEMADKWHIPHVYTDYNAMIESGQIQALIVVTPNVSHYPITMKALEAGLHVLCEKPLAMNYVQAKQMADTAEEKGIKNMVAFTWRFIPGARYVKELIDSGYIGKPQHINLRWYGGGGRNPNYQWRFDTGQAGSGALGDLGSHLLHHADQFFGQVAQVSCQLGYLGERVSIDPDGKPYQAADDIATIMLRFENGALGVIDINYLADEGAPGGGLQMEIHGSAGVLYHRFDFGTIQHVYGVRVGEGALQELPIPDHIWDGTNRENAMETLTHMFSKQDWMARGFITAIAEDKPIRPDFHDGASVQRIVDAALKSHQEHRWIDVDSIN